eukprot:CAMPEP_0175160268 /NCGR_PEP_ID=MMETSP0087-20121206/23917_1 /TAXON_ID=136419 /ORGANISM="Unknown Unknown, Strain D1" /LENGTH=1205 /DNA_ID=CAMNT_0016448477 /DNA_START=1724 /DNA_END=5341 /DNA_ORIENTATION=+
MASNSRNFSNSLRSSSSTFTPMSSRSKRESISTRLSKRDANDSNKENMTPATKKAKTEEPVSKEPLKTPVTLKKGMLNTPGPDDRASKIRSLAEEEFDTETLQEVAVALATKCKSTKFQFSLRVKEQADMIKALKKALHSVRKKQMSFIDSAMKMEAKSDMEMSSTLESMQKTEQQNVDLATELELTQESVDAAKAELGQAKVEAEKVALSLKHTTDQLTDLVAKKEELDTKFADTSAALSKSNNALEMQTMETKKTAELLEAKKQQVVELQAAHKEAESKLHETFEAKLKEVSQELLESNQSNKGLKEEKANLEAKLQENAIEAATQKGEISTLNEKLGASTRDVERCQQEIAELNQKLTQKGNELMSAMESFNTAQRNSEERITTLNNEKMAQYEKLNGEKMELFDKINGLRDEKNAAESNIRALNRELEIANEKHAETKTKMEATNTELSEKIIQLERDFKSAQESWATEKANMEAQFASEKSDMANDFEVKKFAMEETFKTAQESWNTEKSNMEETAREIEAKNNAEREARNQKEAEMIQRWNETESKLKSDFAALTASSQANKESLEKQIEQITTSSQQALKELTEKSEAQMSAQIEKSEAQMAAQIEKTDKQMKDFSEQKAAEFTQLQQTSAAEYASLKESSSNELNALKESTAAEYAALKETSEASYAALKETSEAEFASLKESSSAEFAEMKESSEKAYLELKESSEDAYKMLKESSEEAYKALKESSDSKFNELQTSSNAKITELDQTLSQMTKEFNTFKKVAGVTDSDQLENLVKVSMENDKLKEQLADKEQVFRNLEKAKEDIQGLHHQLFKSEITRRQLHNDIQELKGNVRVYVRVRPPLGEDEIKGARAQIDCEADQRLIKIASGEGNKEYPFSFEHVFNQKASQADIFPEVSNLVQSALDGYNVCLFSYGQTGSGKTHTMQGTASGDHRGIIPRAIEKILDEAARLNGSGWNYTLKASFLEIYNEQVRDLLGNGKETQNLPIKLNTEGNPHVPDLTIESISERSHIDAIMKRAEKHRSVAKTKMNSRSSRSHSVFTLYLKGENAAEGLCVTGSLNLCDLAGSERLDRSGATGDRLKETQAINKSLSCIADVFNALSTKASHVPYRNSKLTHLLQQCFSSQGKSLMFVNLSPTAESSAESLCSLRFAAKVNNTELGNPNKQVRNIKRTSTAVSSESSSAPTKKAKVTRASKK